MVESVRWRGDSQELRMSARTFLKVWLALEKNPSALGVVRIVPRNLSLEANSYISIETVCHSESDISRDYQRNLGSVGRRTGEREFGPDSSGPLAHSL